MNRLRHRFYAGLGVISMGSLLAASLGHAVLDRALHPVDTWREIHKPRGTGRRRA